MPTRLAQHLVARGLLPADRVEEALRRQAIAGGTLDTALLEQGLISEPGMLQALSDVSGVRLVNLADFEPNREVASLIPARIAEKLTLVPLSVEGNALHVACTYPIPMQALQEVGFLIGRNLELWIALECRVRDWAAGIYGTPLAARYATLLAALDPSRPLPATAAPPSSPTSNRPEPRAASSLVEAITLEESLTREMVERLAQSVAEEPILLEVKKAPRGAPAATEPAPPPPAVHPALADLDSLPSPASNVYDRVETVVLDTAGYAAFAREALKRGEPAPAKSPAVVEDEERWTVPSAPHVITPPEDRLGETQELPMPLGFDDAPTQRELRAISRAEIHNEITRRVVLPPSMLAPEAQEVPAPREEAPVPQWTLEQARAALREATGDRERLIEVALFFARRAFDFAAAFAVVRGAAVGWAARGDGLGTDGIGQVSIPLDAASVFRTVALTRGSYVGPVPPDALTGHFLQQMGRGPRSVFLFPVEVKARLVAILYGDSGQKPISQRRLSDLILFCQELPGAFQELIVLRKQRLAAFRAGVETLPEPAAVAPSPTARVGWSPSSGAAISGLGRVASMPAPTSAEESRPPPDFGPILRRLVGPDAAQRARAMAELARSPEASAKELAAAFPGPTAWSRLPVVELPEADELGPIPAALSRLGRAGAQALAPLLDSDDSDTRYLALLTAGNLPFPELVSGVLRGLFDLEPDISSAARAAATALRRIPRFDAAMKDLRQELAARDPLRRSLAARALGGLHDREAIDGLIGLTGSDDQLVAQAAAEALFDITKASFGTNPRAWTAWWADNRTRRRVDWLLAGLRHRELDVRLAASEELSRALGDALGYLADGAPAEREAAVRRWDSAVQSRRGDFDL